jgi:hypothetical protein
MTVKGRGGSNPLSFRHARPSVNGSTRPRGLRAVRIGRLALMSPVMDIRHMVRIQIMVDK